MRALKPPEHDFLIRPLLRRADAPVAALPLETRIQAARFIDN
jgi:hypothetical protein